MTRKPPRDFSHESADEIIFIDSRVENPDHLTASIESEAITYTLDPTKDGVQQIADILSHRQNISAIHLVSHGDDGRLFLGQSVLSDHSLTDYASELSVWGESLSEKGDIIIWGCNVAETQTGQAFVDHLSEITGADIAASTDITGGDGHGGDFELEYQRGTVEEDVLDDSQAAAAYDGALASPTDLAIIPAGANNLIINGGFENPDMSDDPATRYSRLLIDPDAIPGWSGNGEKVTLIESNVSQTANEGDQWLRIDYDLDETEGVYQDIDTVAGQTYVLSFDTAGQRHTADIENEIEVYWRGTLLDTVRPFSWTWDTYSFVVTGSGGQDRLEFRETSGPGTDIHNYGRGNQIDNVRLFEIGAITTPENATNGTIIGTAVGSDIDTRETLTYTLTDNAGGRFAIDADSGEITVANGSLLDHETASSHPIGVRVTDSDGATYDESFTINITDINEAPTALSLDNNSVTENASNGSTVGTVTGTDPDAGETLTYTLTDTAGGRFAIDANTGQITVADGSLLDHEQAPSHPIGVRVTDSDGATYDESFTINITDINEAPTALSLDNNSVTENASNGSTVGTVTGTDPDAGETLTYTLTDTAGGRFAIDANTGQITVADGSLLDHEQAPSHPIGVRVTDSDGATHDQNFTINITDINEAPTALALDANSITENATNGTTIGTVTGSDPDAGETLTYTLTDTAGGRFAIDANTGQITVADGSLLDHEQAPSHPIGVRVTDSDGATHDQNFTINITDINEAPTALALDANSITENATNGTTIGTVTGSDPDAGETLTYTLTDTAGGRFAIDANSGEITVADGSLLDHEQAPSHPITVRVTDSGGATYDQNFTINITDINEAPTALALNANSITENATNGSTVGTVTGTDPDVGETLTYELTDTAGGRFAIDANSGQITVADGSLLDHEQAPSHPITVRVTDSGGATYDQNFTINVSDINEAPTTLALDNTSVTENATNGSAVGTVTGSDPDAGETLTYTLTDTAGGRFAIDAATGQITVADGSLLDHETASSHPITVRVTDSGGATYDQNFTINVSDINEAPTTLALDNTSVTENATNGSAVGNVTGTDPDAGETLTYTLTDTAGGRFAIDANSGAITVADGSLLDHETASSHPITVRVTDSGGLTYDQNFTINITDINEAPTALALDNTAVAENATNGSAVGTVTGSDPDAGETLTYTLTDTAGGRFAIDANTGQITVANSSLLDHEQAPSHPITVRVTDSGGATYDQNFTINITDINEAPTALAVHSTLYQENFDNGAAGWSKNMTENLEPFGEFLGRFDAGSEIVFKEFTLPGTQSEVIINFDIHAISNWNGQSFFVYIDDTPVAVETLDQNNGQNNQADSETNATIQQENETHHFSFRVETTATTVKIGFGMASNQPLNDAALGVDHLTITADISENLTIPENSANGTAVGTIISSDPDAGETLTYSLADDAGGRFAIDVNTGQITVADGRLLNYEDATSHTITAQVTDSSGTTNDRSLVIDISNLDEVHHAQTDYLITGFGQTARIDVFANDTVRDGFIPSVASVDTPGNGTVVINHDNTISYTPDPGFSGEDRFTYVIDNGSGEQTTATVFVNVASPPNIQQDSASITGSSISPSPLSDASRTAPETAERVLTYDTTLNGQVSQERLYGALGAMAKTLYDVDAGEFSQRILNFQSIQGENPLFFQGAGDQSSIWRTIIEANPSNDQPEITPEQTGEEETATEQQTGQTETSAQPPSTEANPESGQENTDNGQQTSLDPGMDQENLPYQGFSAQLAQLSEGFERSRRDLVEVINRL